MTHAVYMGCFRLVMRTFLAAGLVMSMVSCAHMAGETGGPGPVEGASGAAGAFGRLEESIDALSDTGLKRFPLKPVMADGGFFSDRGTLGEPVYAQSGERLELRWEGFFPRYRLYYFPSREHPGVAIGECHFPDGCNNGFFFASDNDGNGVPDSFRLVQWTSIDYGDDDGEPGYLDRYRYIYDVVNDRFYLWQDLLLYRCAPPLSVPPDTCVTFCKPPYETRSVKGRTYPRVFRTRLLESGPLLGNPN